MAEVRDRFEFSAELGVRLKGLRGRCGLTQAQLAQQMGREGNEYRRVIGRLEQGKVEQPSLGLIADYLRACRAGFEDILDILKAYTSRPTVVEEAGKQAVRRLIQDLPRPTAGRVLRYDVKTAVDRRFSGKLPEPAEKRAERSARLAAAWLERERMEETLYFVLKELGSEAAGLNRKYLADYGRKLWGILNRTRKAGPEKRQALLAQARETLASQNLVSPDAMDKVCLALIELHQQQEMTGKPGGSLAPPKPSGRQAEDQTRELERQSAIASRRLNAAPRRKRVRAEELLRQEWLNKYQEYEDARQAVIDRIWDEIRAEVVKAGVPADKHNLYLGLVRQCCHIAAKSEPESEERQKLVEPEIARLQQKGQDPAFARRLCALVLDRYSELRSSIPPDPRRPR